MSLYLSFANSMKQIMLWMMTVLLVNGRLAGLAASKSLK